MKKYCEPACPEHTTIFCPVCDRADRQLLSSVRLPGFIGVKNSTSPTIEKFWRTGDPTVFDHPNRV